MKIVRSSILLLLMLALPCWGWQISSGSRHTPLLELYTSQGCSSCPPADQWLSTLKHHPQLWQGFVPVAFHVDYWDWIGWPDPFARPLFSNRQRLHQQQGGIQAVYTPGFVVNGSEWRDWFRGGLTTAPPQSPGLSGRLSVEQEGSELMASYQPADGESGRERYYLNLVVLGFEISNRVEAGENRGKRLRHDFVALHPFFRQHSGPQAGEQGLEWRLPLPNPIAPPGVPLAIAAWVSRGDRLQPLQAVGGWWAP